ncbi:hypothetical protein [Albibacterium sp.]|uniref:hypothetical protein n=1 Tax=Albibacterium sp. TaxID=2952885 RepID=UPI002C395238|nr:hypothetical protein [Albibacterium sp.]HUH17717.1 hypothetical protein [Albibacterium sp.]
MKRFTAYIMILLSTLALVSCEAVEDRLDIGGFISAEQLDITATPVIVDGKATNKVILNNSSPVLSSWDFGTGKTQKKTDTVLMVVEGENEIIFTGRNPDGSEITKTLTVNVEDLRFPVPPEWGFLTGGTDKEWAWDDTAPAVWGNGGYLGNVAPAWWLVPLADINGQSANEGPGAKMIFSLRGAKFTKVKSDGTTETGTFSFNMNSKTMDEAGAVWAKGKLTLKGTTILNGISPNEGGIKIYEYDILALDDEKMVLSHPEPGAGAWGTAWFWVFKAN